MEIYNAIRVIECLLIINRAIGYTTFLTSCGTDLTTSQPYRSLSLSLCATNRHLSDVLFDFGWAQKIKSDLNSGDACYYFVQSLLPFSLLSKNLNIKIYRTIILPIVLYRCENWSLTLREEHRLRVS
jgi:hypothetical protein